MPVDDTDDLFRGRPSEGSVSESDPAEGDLIDRAATAPLDEAAALLDQAADGLARELAVLDDRGA